MRGIRKYYFFSLSILFHCIKAPGGGGGGGGALEIYGRHIPPGPPELHCMCVCACMRACMRMRVCVCVCMSGVLYSIVLFAQYSLQSPSNVIILLFLSLYRGNIMFFHSKKISILKISVKLGPIIQFYALFAEI